jgi:hypothetical protein
MVDLTPTIYFYTPASYCPDSLPTHPDENWQGFGLGIHAWTLQTYLRLKAIAFPCEFVTEIPESGIVFVHQNVLRSVRRELTPTLNRMLVCFNAESAPSPDAQLQVVQNPHQANPRQGCYFLPHWPQPGLIPRHPARGDRLKTVAFFGHSSSIASELRRAAWLDALRSMGLEWRPVINTNHWSRFTDVDNRWNDYRQIDVIVAVRSFDPRQWQIHRHYLNKPATKLYNAWLAGVPAILGKESAYQAMRCSPMDYLEVSTLDQTLNALQQLQDKPELYRALIHQGHRRAAAIHPDQITQQWLAFLTDTVIPAYDQWCKQSRWQQALHHSRQHWFFTTKRTYDKARTLWLSHGIA